MWKGGASTLWQRLYFTLLWEDLVMKTRQKRREKVPLPKCDHLRLPVPHSKTYLLFRKGGVNFVAKAIFHAFFGGFGHENPPKKAWKSTFAKMWPPPFPKLICCLEREASTCGTGNISRLFWRIWSWKPAKKGVKKYLCQNVTTSISKLICCLEREASKVAQAIFHAFFGGLVQLGGQDISNFRFIYLQPLRGIATRLIG